MVAQLCNGLPRGWRYGAGSVGEFFPHIYLAIMYDNQEYSTCAC